jgi:hypothetical protein
MFLDLANTLA